MVAAKSLNLGPADIKARLGEEVRLGNLRIATDGLTQMNTFFYKDRGDKPAFQVDSFFDVHERARFRRQVSGQDRADRCRPPRHRQFLCDAGVAGHVVGRRMAHGLSSILQEHFFVTPAWSGYAEFGVFLLVALYLIALLPASGRPGCRCDDRALCPLLVGTHFVLMLVPACGFS
jgi:hypothetical protein